MGLANYLIGGAVAGLGAGLTEQAKSRADDLRERRRMFIERMKMEQDERMQGERLSQTAEQARLDREFRMQDSEADRAFRAEQSALDRAQRAGLAGAARKPDEQVGQDGILYRAQADGRYAPVMGADGKPFKPALRSSGSGDTTLRDRLAIEKAISDRARVLEDPMGAGLDAEKARTQAEEEVYRALGIGAATGAGQVSGAETGGVTGGAIATPKADPGPAQPRADKGTDPLRGIPPEAIALMLVNMNDDRFVNSFKRKYGEDAWRALSGAQ